MSSCSENDSCHFSVNSHDCDNASVSSKCSSKYSSSSSCSITSKWSRAFNEKTLNQQKNTVCTMIDGMKFNIDDARNTIAQTEQYLTIIYELLVACQDQVMKASAPSRTEADFCSASLRVKEYVNEINKIVLSAQYNGRYLLTDQTDCVDTENDSTFSSRISIIFRFAGPRGYIRNVGPTLNDFVFELPIVGPCALGLSGEGGGYVGGTTAGNTDDPAVILNFLANGLHNWSTTEANTPDDEGMYPQDLQSDDDVDATVTAFNNAIKIVGVEIDKMRAYRFILCNREKQIKIYQDGQNMSFNLRRKI
tara:strand:- start:97 stop:1017 length:921 start_codon:yes stop_codon:yes gene_type:complete